MQLYDPLVLVDFVAVDDPDKILAVNPLSISRIEMVNVPYIKGDITYGGIISVISRKGDFAGIDLPASGVFINYSFFHEDDKWIYLNSASPNIPDTRNTLFWTPELKFESYNNAKVSFQTSDMSGKYIVLIRGVNSAGEIFSKSVFFEVE